MSKNVVTLKSGLEVSQGHGRLYHPIRPHDFLLTFHSNHRPISHRFRDKRRSPSKIAIFPTPVYLTPPLKVFPLEFYIGARRRKSFYDGATRWSMTNLRDAFIGQSRSPNIVPFHMLDTVSYCAIVTLSLRRALFTIFHFKWHWNRGQRSLTVIESGTVK